MNVSQSRISSWERGSTMPSPAHLKQIADTLGLDPRYLRTGKEPRYRGLTGDSYR